MARMEFAYKGRRVVIEPKNGEFELRIDGEKIKVHQDKDSRTFHTILRAYRSYSDLAEMARHLIDHSPTLKTRPAK